MNSQFKNNYFFSYFSDHAFVIPADVNTAATAPIYAAKPFKSVAIVWLYITSTISNTAGTNRSIKPIIVTTTRKKFFELTPVLFFISLPM